MIRCSSRFPLRGIAFALVGCALFGLASGAAAQPAGSLAPTESAQRKESWRLHRQLEATSLLRGLPWRCVGPTVQGGRVVDIENVPGRAYSFYVAYASGGLWRTDNNGVTFTPLFDAQPTMIMGDVALDPGRPDVVWVGTGENNSSRSSYGGLGVFRSDDGGRSWEPRGLEESDRIGRISIDPRDGDVLVVAVLGRLYTPGGPRGVYRTQDAGRTWLQVLGPDAAGSSDSTRAFTGAIDLVRDPGNPDVLYASTWERSRRPWEFVESGEGSGVWKSTDAGVTWARMGGGFPAGRGVGRIGLALARSRPATLYALIDNQQLLPEAEWDLGDGAVTPKRLRRMSREEFLRQDPEEIEDFIRDNDLDPALDAAKLVELVRKGEVTVAQIVKAVEDANANLFATDIRGPEVWRSDDAGGTWRRAHEQPLREFWYTYGYYFAQIRVAPDDAEKVYIMGVPMCMSTDGGRTWKGINGRDVHVDHHELWFDPQNPQRVIGGNDGGLAQSYDGGATWVVLNPNPVGQFYTVSVDMASPYRIYGGLQDNGVYRGSAQSVPGRGEDWTAIGGGDGMYVQVDPRDDATTYLGYQFGYYTRIDASGKRQPARPRNKLTEEPLRYNWQTPIQLSAHNADMLYFGANRLFRSMDRGETWTAISADLTTAKERGDVPYGTITSLHESSRRFGMLWVGTDDGHVHVSHDGGASWREVAPGGKSAGRWVSRVEASRHADLVAHLALNGYRDDDMHAYLYRTEDGGATWRDIAGGLPDEPVNVVREDPVNPDVLYVGTDRGVYVSLDRGARWQALQGWPVAQPAAASVATSIAASAAAALEGALPNVPVHDLVVHPRERELVAGTHGRSVWVVDVLPVQDLTAAVQAAPVHVFSLEPEQFQRGWRSRRSPWFYTGEDDPALRIPFWVKPEVAAAGGRDTKATVTVRDADDRVLRRDELALLPGMNTWAWDLLLDPALAVEAERERAHKEAAEAAKAEKGKAAKAKPANDTKAGGEATAQKDPREGELGRYPLAEAARLGRPLYVPTGTYSVRVDVGREHASTELEVKAPEARRPRAKSEPQIRGRHKKK